MSGLLSTRLYKFVWFLNVLVNYKRSRLHRGRAPRQSVGQLFYVLPHMRQSWETMTSVSAGHIILTPDFINDIREQRVIVEKQRVKPSLLSVNCKTFETFQKGNLRCFIRFFFIFSSSFFHSCRGFHILIDNLKKNLPIISSSGELTTEKVGRP